MLKNLSQYHASATGTPIAFRLAMMNWNTQICTLNLLASEPQRVRPVCPTHQRLVRAFARLQDIQLVRNHRQDPFFGKSAEVRIIWRELLDLEVQDVDEQFERLSRAAASHAQP